MTQDAQHQVLRVVLHAPTPEALERARNNALNLRRADPDAELCIIVNAGVVRGASVPMSIHPGSIPKGTAYR